MPRLSAETINLSESEREALEQLLRRAKTPQQIALRVKIILRAAAGENQSELAAGLGISLEMSRLWRRRWLALAQREVPVGERLQDLPRPGSPATFSLEQITQLYAIACDPPEKYQRPISHWSARELADEMIQQGIVTSISERHVGRLLKEADLKPHQHGYWLHPPPTFSSQPKPLDICEVYKLAGERADRGELTFSLDEMTGIQALERNMPDIPLKPGRCVRHEFEYTRHGTQTLIASFNVATGEIALATVDKTRTEQDLAAHVSHLLAQFPQASKYHLVMDYLCLGSFHSRGTRPDELRNTHQSEALVRIAAGLESDSIALGCKGNSGILYSMPSRTAFLADPSHRLTIHFTPKHCSWLNQIEIWFGILMRKLLRRANFTSTDDLKTRILAFVDYFNRTMAKPFKWNYTGKPLVA